MATCCADYTAGMLRDVVAFERATRTGDGFGGITQTWATISGAPTRAYVKPLSGREVYESQRVEAHASVMIAVRYFSDIRERDRVTIGGREYNIRHIRNVENRNRWLEIRLEEGVAV